MPGSIGQTRQVRLHPSLGYRSPMAYEAAMAAKEMAEAQA